MKLNILIKYLITTFYFSFTLAYYTYDKKEKLLSIEDYSFQNGTKESAEYGMSKYNDEDVTSLYYSLVVMIQAHNEDDLKILDKIKDRDFPDDIKKYKHLEHLDIAYDKAEYTAPWYEKFHDGKIKKNFFNNFKLLKTLDISHIKLSQDNINEIATLSELESLFLYECTLPKLNYEPLKNLKKLTSLQIFYYSGNYEYGRDLEKNFLKYFKNLKKLIINGVHSSQANIDEIGTLTNLETLTYQVNDDVNLEPINNLNKLTTLNIDYYEHWMDGDEYEDLPRKVKKLCLPKSLKKLVIDNVEISQDNANEIFSLSNLEHLQYDVDSKLNLESQKKLENLTILYMHYNNYDHETAPSNSIKKLNLPNNLKELYAINMNLSDDNYKEIVGLKKLEKLTIGKNYSPEEVDLNELRKKYSSSNNNPNISKDGKCGKDNGNTICPDDKCCSKYGYCGTSDKHCYSGCQSEFGKCKQNISTNDKCGKDNGNTRCPSGQCCSKYGYCGTSDKHCYSGCQSEFGKCKQNTTTKTKTTTTKTKNTTTKTKTTTTKTKTTTTKTKTSSKPISTNK